MKRLRGIGVQLVIFFIIAISIPTFMLAIDVVVTTKSTQRSNMQLTSEQTLQETKKGFETYLKTLSQPIDLLTRKNEVKHLEDQGTIDNNVKARILMSNIYNITKQKLPVNKKVKLVKEICKKQDIADFIKNDSSVLNPLIKLLLKCRMYVVLIYLKKMQMVLQHL